MCRGRLDVGQAPVSLLWRGCTRTQRSSVAPGFSENKKGPRGAEALGGLLFWDS